MQQRRNTDFWPIKTLNFGNWASWFSYDFLKILMIWASFSYNLFSYKKKRVCNEPSRSTIRPLAPLHALCSSGTIPDLRGWSPFIGDDPRLKASSISAMIADVLRYMKAKLYTILKKKSRDPTYWLAFLVWTGLKHIVSHEQGNPLNYIQFNWTITKGNYK